MASRIVHPAIQVGDRFGRLVVTSVFQHQPETAKRPYLYCGVLCDCGTVKHRVRAGSLKTGESQSCGCRQRQLARELNKKSVTEGGHRKYPPEWRSTERAYCNAKQRCQNPKSPEYKNYGARGILWLFESVYQFVQAIGLQPKGFQLDRIDCNGHYEPKNCRWVSPKENCQNQRKSCWWYVDGKRFDSSYDAANALGVVPSTVFIWCKGYTDRGRYYPPKPNCWVEKKYDF